MDLFSFDQSELLVFFVVLVRYATLIAVLPFTGDRTIPVPLKILLSLVISVVLFPVLVSTGRVDPHGADVWGTTAMGLVGTVASEALFGLAIGYTARLLFQTVDAGGNMLGTFMGYAMASQYDPHQEAQSQVVTQIQATLAMLIFLTLDGHHLMLRAALDSYAIVGLGKATFTMEFARRLITISGQTMALGLQMAAPMAVALFGVNVVYGVMSRAMPQLNILVLSLSVSALVGLAVMFLSMPEFQHTTAWVMGRVGDEMVQMMGVLKGT